MAFPSLVSLVQPAVDQVCPLALSTSVSQDRITSKWPSGFTPMPATATGINVRPRKPFWIYSAGTYRPRHNVPVPRLVDVRRQARYGGLLLSPAGNRWTSSVVQTHREMRAGGVAPCLRHPAGVRGQCPPSPHVQRLNVGQCGAAFSRAPAEATARRPMDVATAGEFEQPLIAQGILSTVPPPITDVAPYRQRTPI